METLRRKYYSEVPERKEKNVTRNESKNEKRYKGLHM